MCKVCVKKLENLCSFLLKTITFTQAKKITGLTQSFSTAFFNTFSDVFNKLLVGFNKMRWASFPTLSTTAITTTILINNKEIGGQEALV